METTNRKMMTMRLVESAIMIALATILSMVKINGVWIFGGSVTLLSMLPIALIAYRYSVPWGLGTGFVFGLIQLMLGFDNLKYATWWLAFVVIILFDYLVAFSVLGFSGIFRGKFKNQPAELAAGIIVAGLLRYFCHYISGVTVWRQFTPSGQIPEIYSLVYNGSYMIPEIIITAIGAFLIASALDLTSVKIRPKNAFKK